MLYLVDNKKKRVIGFYESPKDLKRGMDLLSTAEQLPSDYHIATEEPECFTNVTLEKMPPRTRFTNSNSPEIPKNPPLIKKKSNGSEPSS